jgi:hypothetical protein
MCNDFLIKRDDASELSTLQKHGRTVDRPNRVFITQMLTTYRNKSLLSGLHAGDETTQHGPEMRMMATRYARYRTVVTDPRGSSIT